MLNYIFIVIENLDKKCAIMNTNNDDRTDLKDIFIKRDHQGHGDNYFSLGTSHECFTVHFQETGARGDT